MCYVHVTALVAEYLTRKGEERCLGLGQGAVRVDLEARNLGT